MTALVPTQLQCRWDGCEAPGAARVAVAQLGPNEEAQPGWGLMIVRPAGSPVQTGLLLCVEHAHVQMDVMLLRALPQERPR